MSLNNINVNRAGLNPVVFLLIPKVNYSQKKNRVRMDSGRDLMDNLLIVALVRFLYLPS